MDINIYVKAKFTESNQTRYYLVPPSQRSIIMRGDLIITSMSREDTIDESWEFSKVCFAQVIDVLGGVPENYRHPVIPFIARIDRNYIQDGIREAAHERQEQAKREQASMKLMSIARELPPVELARLLSLSGNPKAEEIYELLR